MKRLEPPAADSLIIIPWGHFSRFPLDPFLPLPRWQSRGCQLAMSSISSSGDHNIRADRAYFDGMFLAYLAYGALITLYIQLVQVLWGSPKRTGHVFWGIIIYSNALVLLATLAVIGQIKFAELMYVTSRLHASSAEVYHVTHPELWPNALSQISATLLQWVGDILMLYRLMVLWGYQPWIIVFSGLLYLAHLSISILLLISETWSRQPHSRSYQTAYYSLCVALHVALTILICLRIFIMRHKAEKVLGKLQASFYTSPTTMFVESAAFSTIWSLVNLIALESDSWVQYVFLQPYSNIFAISRMLIAMRMARNCAWSKDIITASIEGELEWQISSTRNSMAVHNVSEHSSSNQNLPQKFMNDSLSFEGDHY